MGADPKNHGRSAGQRHDGGAASGRGESRDTLTPPLKDIPTCTSNSMTS